MVCIINATSSTVTSRNNRDPCSLAHTYSMELFCKLCPKSLMKSNEIMFTDANVNTYSINNNTFQ